MNEDKFKEHCYQKLGNAIKRENTKWQAFKMLRNAFPEAELANNIFKNIDLNYNGNNGLTGTEYLLLEKNLETMVQNLTEDILILIQNETIDSILNVLDFPEYFLEDIEHLINHLNTSSLMESNILQIKTGMEFLIRLGGGSNDFPKEIIDISIDKANIILDTIHKIKSSKIDTPPSIEDSLNTLITNCKYRTINEKNNNLYELKHSITHEQKEILQRGYQIALTLSSKGLNELNSEEKLVLAYLFSSYSDYTALLHSICDSLNTVLYINVQYEHLFLKVTENVIQKYKKKDELWNQNHGLHAIINIALEFILMVVFEPYKDTRYYFEKVGSRPPANIRQYLLL